MSEIQAVLFPRYVYTKSDAKRWLKRNKLKLLKGKKLHLTDRFIRARIKEPSDFTRMRTKLADDNSGIVFIIGFN